MWLLHPRSQPVGVQAEETACTRGQVQVLGLWLGLGTGCVCGGEEEYAQHFPLYLKDNRLHLQPHPLAYAVSPRFHAATSFLRPLRDFPFPSGQGGNPETHRPHRMCLHCSNMGIPSPHRSTLCSCMLPGPELTDLMACLLPGFNRSIGRG